MSIEITTAPGKWVVRAGGAVLGESASAVELREDGYDPVIYFPRGDIAMTFLDRTDRQSTCPKKGEATYYSIVTRSTTFENAVWSYESPKDAVSQIAGHLAFDTDQITVEQL